MEGMKGRKERRKGRMNEGMKEGRKERYLGIKVGR
jgi:hypothetical protein